MATIAELVTKLTVNATQFKQDMLRATESVEGFSTKAKLAIAAVAALITGILYQAFGSLKSIILDSTQKMSELVHSSERLGIGVEGLEKLQFAAQQAGVSADTLNTLLKFMEKNVGNVGTGLAGAKLSKYFDEMGLSAKDLLKLPIQDQFDTILTGLKSISNQDQRTAAAMAIFGRGGSAALQLVAEGTQDAEKAFDKFGIGVSGKQAQAIKDFGKDVKALDGVWQGFKNQLTAVVVPALENLIKWVQNTIVSMGGLGPIAKIVGGDIVQGLQVAFVVLQGLKNAVDIVIIAFDALAITAIQTFRVATLGIADLTTNISKTQKGFEDDARARSRSILQLGPDKEAGGFSPNTAPGGSQPTQKVQVEVNAGDGLIAKVVNSLENQRRINTELGRKLGNASSANQ